MRGLDRDRAESIAYVGLGSNVGDRIGHLTRALELIESIPNVSSVEPSPMYASEAHVLPGDPPGPEFVNLVARLRTTLRPPALLDECLAIEKRFGRERQAGRWLPRTIDIDILLFDDMVYSDDRLTIPHPRIGERRFVLAPLCDLDPSVHVPVPFGASAETLLAACSDHSRLTTVESGRAHAGPASTIAR